MADSFLDAEGLTRVIEQNDNRYVRQVEGKDLSSNDFTDEYKQMIEDLAYEEIAITSFTNNHATNEKGSSISEVTLTWTLNKTPTALTLAQGSNTAETLGVEETSKTINLATPITANTSFTLSATDERDLTVSKSTTINFINGVYYGVLAFSEASEITNEVLLAMTKTLKSGRTGSFTVNADTDQKIIYAFPTSYGTPTFNVGGFDGGFVKATTFEFTNASGYTESYDVWASVNAGLGSTTVTVK